MMARAGALAPHLLAAGLSLLYAYAIFRSDYGRTGLQFVAPLLVILGCHVTWIVATGRARPGYADIALGRTAGTAAGMAVAVTAFEMLAPMPSRASGMDETVGGILVVLACVVVLVGVLAVIAIIVHVTFRMFAAFVRMVRGKDRSNDLGTLLLIAGLLAVTSAEGLPGSYAFDGRGAATAHVRTHAAPKAVWVAMATATSPTFPIPVVLQSLPQPVAVTTDEGVDLGARRVVRIAGREGAGDLSMRVTERSVTRTRLTVVSDTSPTADWVAFEAITYDVLPHGDGTEIRVTLEYESLLAPAWIFGPIMRAASYMAAGVLARDTAERSPSL